MHTEKHVATASWQLQGKMLIVSARFLSMARFDVDQAMLPHRLPLCRCRTTYPSAAAVPPLPSSWPVATPRPPATNLHPTLTTQENLGLAAEHGFYWRPNARSEWLVQDPEARFGWKDIVEPILKLYTESTDGSFIEAKDSALVWHYRDADPDFGSWQAKELLDHLEGVLSNEPIEVVPGQSIVEVKPQGVSKGKVVERLLHDVASGGQPPDFVLCIGNDRSDEDMFTAMEGMQFSPHMPAEVFACTVGQKPSKAPFYVNDPADVLATLTKLAEAHHPATAAHSPSVSFA